nr:MAG TPA: hypothetical protein [Caudoviricetes sp.]
MVTFCSYKFVKFISFLKNSLHFHVRAEYMFILFYKSYIFQST